MFGVECFDTHDEPISHYTQWDINQTLKIVLYGMDDGYMKNAPYVHFANIKSSEALVVRSTLQGDDTVLVDIPNQLLQESYPLLIYVYLNDSSDASSQRTIVKIEIPVHKRARPSDYEYVENINRITAEAIKQDIYDDFMDEVRGGNITYPYVTFIDESTSKHVNLKVSDEKLGLYVDSTNRQLLDTGDIVNNLMTNSSTKALSASMGATIKNMVDVIPDNIDEKIEEHDSSPTSHSDIRDDISSVSSAVDTMQNSIAEIENKIDDIDFRLDDTISGSGVLTTTDTLVDFSPIEMKIKGNTRQNLWVNPIATKNGITISNADDGAITISGSATATTTVTTDKIYTMRAGVTYSIGADKLTPVNGFVFSVHQYSSEDRLLAGSDSITYASKGRTITTNAKMAYVKFVVVIPSGTSVSETYHIMLNAGEELEPWCAPGLNSVDELAIVVSMTDSDDDGTTTPIDLEGNSLHSLPDGTCDELTIDATGAVTLVQRVGAATIPADAGSTVWNEGSTRIQFNLPASYPSPAVVSDSTHLRSDKIPPRPERGSANVGSYVITAGGWGYARVDGATSKEDVVSLVGGGTVLYPLAEPKTISLPSVTLPSFLSDKSNIYTTSNVPTAGLTVRYWKKSGDLVANLYKLLLNAQRETS